MNKIHKAIQYAVRSPYAFPFFVGAVFIEPFFFMPTIPLYIIYGIEMPRKALYYAFVGAVVSILGAASAYWLAYYLSKTYGMAMLYYFIAPEKIALVKSYCSGWLIWGVIALFSFLPAPFKVITLPSGFLQISFVPFILSVAVGRFARYIILGTGLSIWGAELQKIIDRYFYLCVVLIIGIILLSWWLFH